MQANQTNPLKKERMNEVIEDRHTEENGKTVVHQYQLGRFLGKGGFAKCYEAKDMATGNVLAVKIIEKSTLNKGRAKQKLLSEISIQKEMSHSGIVKFEGYFEDNQRAFILLEMCPNQSLKEVLKRRKRLHELEVQYYSQIIPALQYIHSMNVIHRDMKLGNLFLGKNMEVKVGYFGLASKTGFSYSEEKNNLWNSKLHCTRSFRF